jgi:hypothetical protein
MPHCQICLVEVPDHLDDCPVKTGRPVVPGELENYTAYAQAKLMKRLERQRLSALLHKDLMERLKVSSRPPPERPPEQSP